MAKQPTGNSKDPPSRPHEPTIRNRRAFHDYHIVERVEAGLALTGTEIKSLRAGRCQIEDAYARITDGEVWLLNMNVAIYPQAVGVLQHEPLRKRKCLLHRRQIAQLQKYVQQKGHTVVPLDVHFHNGRAKVELGVGVGKQAFDKRQDLKKRDAQRDMQRAMRRRG